MEIQLRPRGVFRFLVSVLVFLTVAHLLTLIAEHFFGYKTLKGFVPMFNLNAEKNVPTLVSTIYLATCGCLLAVIATAHKRRGEPFLLWAFLGFIFFLLGLDEFTSIHERIGTSLSPGNLPVLLKVFWVVPYGLLVLVMGVMYFKFLFRLPLRFRKLFIVSGALYVFGALILELPFAYLYIEFGPGNIFIVILSTFEEVFEICGVSLFTYSLLSYLAAQFAPFSLGVSDEQAS